MRGDVVGEGEAGRSQDGGSSAMSSSAERFCFRIFEYASLRVNKQELTHKENNPDPQFPCLHSRIVIASKRTASKNFLWCKVRHKDPLPSTFKHQSPLIPILPLRYRLNRIIILFHTSLRGGILYRSKRYPDPFARWKTNLWVRRFPVARTARADGVA
jgi:hypothetical protein